MILVVETCERINCHCSQEMYWEVPFINMDRKYFGFLSGLSQNPTCMKGEAEEHKINLTETHTQLR